MKPFRYSALHSHVLNLAGLLTLSFGSASGADLYWDGTGTSGTVTSWDNLEGWSTVVGGGTDPVGVPGQGDAVVFRANNIKAGARTITLDAIQSIQGIKTINYGGGVYSQEATTTVTGTSSGRVLKLFGMPTADPNKTIGIDHAAGGITLGTAADPVRITIHSPHQTWHSNVVGGTAPGAAALVVNGEVSAGIFVPDVTLSLTGQNTGTTINGKIHNGGATNLNVELGGTASSVWTFSGTNTYSGTTKINSGTLRITRADSITKGLDDPNPLNSKVSVETGATLALRVGPDTFSPEEISMIGARVNFKDKSIFALDTLSSVAEVDGGIAGSAIIRKVGASTLILNGPNTYTSSSPFEIDSGNVAIRRPTGVFAGTGTNAGKTVVAGNSALLAIMGPDGFSETELSSLPGLVTSTNANIGISTIEGDLNYSGPLLGARRLTKGDPGTLTLLGNRTEAGGVNVMGGTLRVLSLPDGGGSSPVGTYPANPVVNAAGGIWLNGGTLMYAGPGVTTDRFFETRTSGTLDSSGSGPLILDAATPFPHNGSGSRTITLTGDAPGENKITGVIGNAGSGAVSITKLGSADWTLSGANTYTGTTRNNGGLLTLDYTTADPINGTVLVNAGQIRVKAAAAGTTESFPLTIAANQHTYGHFKLEGGVDLTVPTLSGGGLTQRGDLIDLSGHPSNSITVTALNGDNKLRAVSGILMSNTATTSNGRANLIVRDATGAYGFPALSGGASGNLIRASTFTNVLPGTFTNVSSNTTHYRFGPGGYVAGANLIFNTLTFDSTFGSVSPEGQISVELKTFDVNPNGTGKAILATGNNDITISNPDLSAGAGLQPIWWHNYLEPNATLHLKLAFGYNQYMIFDGSGFTDYSGSGFGANFFVNGGLVRVSSGQSPSDTLGEFRVAAGGVLELGASITDHFGIDFGKGVRSSPAGGIAFYGDSGLSAHSGVVGENATKRIVDFRVRDDITEPFVSQQLTWGAARFLTLPETDTDGDFAFKLSSTRADIPIEIRNKIDLNGRSRTVDVADGSGSLDAELTGELSGGLAAGLVKAGAGTLRLSGVNTYLGETQIRDGILRVDSASLDPKSSLSITGDGELEITSGDVTVAAVSLDGVAKPNGEVIDSRISGGKLYVAGDLTPYQQWVVDKTLAAGESAGDFDADFDGIKNVIEYAVGSEPKSSTPSVLTKLAGSPSAVRFNRAADRTDLDLYLESSPTLGTPWTVIASSLDGGTFASTMGASVVVDQAGTVVTVTDNRAVPVGGKIFYRLRGEIP